MKGVGVTNSSGHQRCFLTHFVHVDADGATSQTDFLRNEEDVESGAAAEVNNRLALQSRILSLRLHNLM